MSIEQWLVTDRRLRWAGAGFGVSRDNANRSANPSHYDVAVWKKCGRVGIAIDTKIELNVIAADIDQANDRICA